MDAPGVALRLLVVDPERRSAMRTHERIVDLPAGSVVTWTIEEQTTDLALKAYSVLLQRMTVLRQLTATGLD